MSSTKTNAQMLTSIKQYNKTAREIKAKKEGFTSCARMVLYIETEIKMGRGGDTYSAPTGKSTASATRRKTSAKPTLPPQTKTRASGKTPAKAVLGTPTIHVVDICDKSGSMSGSKLSAAIKGINIGIQELKTDPADVKYTYTLCEFSTEVTFKYIKAQLDSVSTIKMSSQSSTSLFDAIGETIQKIKLNLIPDSKVLVNIYTDGQENSSRHYTATAINSLIQELSQVGWTFTFIGTAADVKYAQQMLSIDASNTLVYDGTGAGLEKSLASNSVARSAYSQKVSAGEDVSKGFYKDIN